MNILYLHASAELYGSDRVLLNLLISLDKEKFFSLVLLPFKGQLCDELDKNNIKYLIMDLPVLRRNLFSIKGIAVYLWQFISSFIKISKLITAYKIDIVHSNTSAIFIGGIISRIYKKKHIWQIMEIVEKPKIVSKLISQTVGLFADQVFCISDAVRHHFLKNNIKREEKFITLYHGVDLNEYAFSDEKRIKIRRQISISENDVLVGFIGRFNGWKGQDIFLDAAKKCLKEDNNKNIKFLLIGSCFKNQENYLDELNDKIANESTLKSNVIILGFQNNIDEWLSAIDVFVLPSKLPEPNATILIAAMAASRAVIGTNIGGTVETIIDNVNGFLIPPSSSTELSQKILLLANDGKLRNEFGNNSLKQVKEKFSLDNYNKRITQAYG